MTPDERTHLEQLDRMVLEATSDELEKIQNADLQTQLDGLSFYDAVNLNQLTDQSIRLKSNKSR